MPDKDTLERARADKRAGKSPSTQAGEFVREEIEHIREGQHGARSAKQAIAIGLSKARRAGVDLAPPRKGRAAAETRHKAEKDLEAGESPHPPSPTRSRAAVKALQRESPAAASPLALKRQAKAAAAKRPVSERSAAAREAARTKGPQKRSAAAKKAAATRKRREPD